MEGDNREAVPFFVSFSQTSDIWVRSELRTRYKIHLHIRWKVLLFFTGIGEGATGRLLSFIYRRIIQSFLAYSDLRTGFSFSLQKPKIKRNENSRFIIAAPDNHPHCFHDCGYSHHRHGTTKFTEKKKTIIFRSFSVLCLFLQSTCFSGHQIRKDHISTTHQQCMYVPRRATYDQKRKTKVWHE